jgi:hypothetical protein
MSDLATVGWEATLDDVSVNAPHEGDMRLYWQARMLLLVIALVAGGCVAVWCGAVDYRAAHTETAPTVLPVDAFDKYGGQRWLKIDRGVFATDHAVIHDAPRSQGDSEDQAVFYVPLVPPGWRPNDPVHVICKLGPGPRSKVAGWLQENGRGTLRSFTGVVVNEPAAPLFPTLKLVEPTFMLQEGGRLPHPATSLGIIVLGVGMFLAGTALGVWLVRVARANPTKPQENRPRAEGSLHFSMRIQCHHCRHTFNVCVHADKPLDPQARYALHCPMNGSRFVVSASVFRPVDCCPKGAVEGVEWQPGAG